MYTIHAMYSDPRFRTDGPSQVWPADTFDSALRIAIQFATQYGKATVVSVGFDRYRIEAGGYAVYWVQHESYADFPVT